MYSSNKSDRLMWQHPFVNIFKQFKVDDWKKSSKEGDVSAVVDKHIKTTVYKIQGSVPAGNYIQFPRTTTQSLGLTGRYLYILFKPIPTKYFVVHVDTLSEDGLVVRISFSNLFKEFKSTATWLQFPFACHAAKGSVEHFASLGARQDFMGPAPLSQKWTMLVLDLHYILSMYMNRKYSFMKNIRLCANILVKNCFTSDICYDPRLSVRQARSVGIKAVDENFAPMPREMNFFLPKDKEWDDLYDVVRFPLETPASSNQVLPYDSMQRVDDSPQNRFLVHKKKREKKSSKLNSTAGVIKSPRRDKGKVVDVTRNQSIFSSTSNMNATIKPPEKALRKKPKIVSELPSVELSLVETPNASCSDPGASVVETSSGDVHVFAGHCSPDRDIVVHRHYSGKTSGNPRVASTDIRSHRSTFTSKGNLSSRSYWPQSRVELNNRYSLKGATCLEPSPILKLQRVIGFGNGVSTSITAFKSLSAWHPTSCSKGNEIVVYAVRAVVVAMETGDCRQRFFIGHSNDVTSIAFNQQQDHSPCILASCQCGNGGNIRIWRFETQKCAAIIRPQQAHGMQALAFSATGAVLVGIGRDGHGKTLFMVWDTSSALKNGSVSVIAKANTDVEIHRLHVCPTDDTRMVTCGRDNIRFWRVRSNQLRSCPAPLPPEQKLEEIADVKFAPTGTISAKNRPNETGDVGGLSVFACTKAGFVIEIDFQKVTMRNVHKLYPSTSSSSGDKATKGISLNSLHFAESYLATGSDDGMLRLWPLDLAGVFLEVEHEGPVTEIDITRNGMKVLAATSVGTLGYLDVSERKYTTIMRSHTDVIKDSCMDGLRRTLSTCSADRTIRVWDIDTMKQLYDFATPDDPPTTVCCHPLIEVFACGFESGYVRVFHVSSTSILSEHLPNNVKMSCVLFTFAGQRLVASDEQGNLTLYDTSDVEHAGAPLHRSLLKVAAPGEWGPHALVASPDDRRVAFVGPNEFTITVSASATLDELLRVDVSSGIKAEPDILSLRPKIDAPVRLAFSENKTCHLLVLTRACRLLKLDAKSGKLLSVTEDMHRSRSTALCASDDGKHLITAGDKIIKVWDYQMSKDINFQAFIGHSTSIHTLIVTPDRLKLITVGEDAIFMWNILSSSEYIPVENGGVVIGKPERRSSQDQNKGDSGPEDECPQPHHPPTPHRGAKDQSSAWIPPETLRTSDLDASHISEFTVDAQMMEKLAEKKTKSHETGTTNEEPTRENEEQITDGVKELKLSSKHTDRIQLTTTDDGDDVPVKVAWNGRPKLDLSTIVTPSARPPIIDPPARRPSVLCHYASNVSSSQPPQRTYAAPLGEEGLTLQAVIGYNGNGRGNLLWNPDNGLLAYTSGAIVILEHLADNKKHYLRGHTEEIACLAMQYDGQIIASASASNGLVQSKICLWDTSSLSCRATLKHHDYDVINMAYSRDDRFLVTLGDYRECSVVVWSAFTGTSSPVVLACTKTPSSMHKIAWNPNTPNEFVTVGSNASVCFWLVEEQPQKVTLNLHDTEVPDAIQRDEASGKLLDFTSVCFGEDSTVYIGSSTGLVSVWDTSTNVCILHWKGDSAEILYMQARGDRLLVAGASRGVKLWSVIGTEEARCHGNTSKNFVIEDELSFNSPIISGAFDETLDMGIVGTIAGTLWYLDWTNRSTVRMVTGHTGKITDIAFDDGSHFATSCDQGTVRLWDSITFELSVQFQVIDSACCCLVFSHVIESSRCSIVTQPHMLAVGYQDGNVRVFDLDKLILKLKMQPHSNAVTSVQFAADNNTLLSGAKDGTVAATSLSTGVTLRVLKDHRGAPINNIACSLRMDHPASLFVRDDSEVDQDGPTLSLICGGDRRVSVWDTDWKHDVCNMIDWLTFPAPCFAPDGSKLPKDDKKSLKCLPPSVCIFHPSNPDILVYCGYGMDKSVQHYSLTQRKVVKTTSIPSWASCMDIDPSGNLMVIGTDTRLVELVDAYHGTFQDFIGHSAELRNVRFSPDRKILLTTASNELFVWKLKE